MQTVFVASKAWFASQMHEAPEAEAWAGHAGTQAVLVASAKT